MEQLNKEFNVPYYIFEEIIDYVELTAKGYSKYMKWENIKSLLRLAVISNRLTKEQAQFLKPKMAYKSPKLENISYICYNYDIEKFLIIYFAFSV